MASWRTRYYSFQKSRIPKNKNNYVKHISFSCGLRTLGMGHFLGRPAAARMLPHVTSPKTTNNALQALFVR